MPSKDFAARRNPAIAGCTATGVLKILALVFMFIDHAGKMLFPQIAEMRMLGRIAFPLYCWCMVVGISYTRSVPKYLGRLMLIGLVSQPIYMVALNHSWNQPNIFLTLLVALCGVTGALLHTLNHSLFKSLLFFGAGNILSQTHTTSLDALGGLAKHMPLTAILFLTGTAAICALPPLNGFVSELLIYLGMLDGIASGSNVLASAAGLAALALIGGLVVLAFTKLYGTVFLGSPRTHEVAESSEADTFRIAAMALPLAGILFVGLFPRAAVSAATRAAGFFLRTPADAADWLLSPPLAAAGRTAWILIAVVCLLLWLRRRTLRTRAVAKGPTWGCGFTAPNVRMQYTGESFSEGLQSIATSLTQNSGQGSPVGKGEIFPAAHSFDIGHRDRIGRLFAAWWVELLRVINQRVMRLRTGKINHYILFALAFLGLVFLLSVFNAI